MPLVIPGLQGPTANKTDEWTNKLMGKKLSEDATTEMNFCKRDLPEQCRIIKPGQMVTKDFQEDRLNVCVKEDGTVSSVYHG